MRIISQDGTIDVPYEMVVIQRFRSDVYFLNRNLTGVEDLINDIKLADYSTEEKAIKAMEMLREHNECVAFLKTIINTEKGAQFVSILPKTAFDKMTQNYFQFPKDDEVEV
mgnify:CR=1 FL=1|jgi:hypothetical protein